MCGVVKDESFTFTISSFSFEVLVTILRSPLLNRDRVCEKQLRNGNTKFSLFL